MTNVSRYNVSGTTHRNGTAATSCVSVLVVPKSTTDAHAGSANHMARAGHEGGGPSSSADRDDGAPARFCTKAQAAHSRVNVPRANDHATACARRDRFGSTRNG